jgi:hypothetical protein
MGVLKLEGCYVGRCSPRPRNASLVLSEAFNCYGLVYGRAALLKGHSLGRIAVVLQRTELGVYAA